MKQKVKESFYTEIKSAISFIQRNELDSAFFHIERAHILGQSYVIPHSICHYKMFEIYLLKKEYLKSFGQVIRLLFGIVGSFIGILPIGNTGGSDVSMFKKMEIPSDLKVILEGK